jgi:hypothetical protein
MVIDRDALRRATRPVGHQKVLFAALVADPGSFVATRGIAEAMVKGSSQTSYGSYIVALTTYALAAKLRRAGYDIMVHKILGRALVHVGPPPATMLDDDGRTVERKPHPLALAAAERLRAAGDGIEFVSRP